MAVTTRRARALFDGYLGPRSANTKLAYQQDLDLWTRFVESVKGKGCVSPEDALCELFNATPERAYELVETYRAHLLRMGAATKTINRRLAFLRAIAKWARATGAIRWHLQVRDLPDEASRDTRGPTLAVVNQMLRLAAKTKPPIGPRDVAILRLMIDLALRIGEVVRLNLADIDLDSASIWILGKGKRNKVRLTMPAPTVKAIRRWVTVRGKTPGPLFRSYAWGGYASPDDRRLLTRSIYRIVVDYGARCGVQVRPHGLRHTSITAAVEAANKAGIGLDQVRQFSRHATINTLLTYRDEVANVQGQIAGMVAKQVR